MIDLVSWSSLMRKFKRRSEKKTRFSRFFFFLFFHFSYCLDNKFYWIESTCKDFFDWNHDDNLLLLMPHLDDTVYSGRIRSVPHRNYVAIDEKIGPVVFT